MIVFDKLVEDIRKKNGFCTLADNRYDTISAVQVHCVTNKKTQLEVHYRIDRCTDGRSILKILDGVTGYESWYVDDLKRYWKDVDQFCACAGTANRWDELWLDATKVKQIIGRV